MDLLKRITVLALAGALALSLLTGCGQSGTASSSTSASGSAPEVISQVDIDAIEDICVYLTGLPSDEVVATAAGMDIPAGELLYWIAASCDEMLNYYYYYYGVMEMPWDTTDSSGETTLAQFILEDALDYAVLQRLAEKKGTEAGLTVSQEDKDAIQAALDSARAEAEAQGVSAEQLMWEQGLTQELFCWNYECDYLYQGLMDLNFGEGSPNPPTEEDIRASREQAGYYKVKHILLATVDTTTREPLDEATAAKKKTAAEDLLRKLKESSDPLTLFDQLMNEYSEDPGLATNPEGYEFQTNTSVDPAFEEAALALEEGQISGLVEGVSGYHIILRLPLDVDLETDKEEYITEKMSGLMAQWIEQADVQPTEAFEKLSAQEIYDRLNQYRDAMTVRLEQNAPQE